MEIFTYRAASLQEALMLVRHELGPDASILQTREVGGRFFGLLGKRSIEVEASRDAKVARRLTQLEQSSASVHHSSSDINSEVESQQPEQRSRKRRGAKRADSSMAASTAAAASIASSGSTDTRVAMNEATEARAQRMGSLDITEDDASTSGHLLIERHDADQPDSYSHSERTALPRASRSSAPTRSAAYANANPSSVDASPAETHEARSNHLSPAMFEVFTELLDADVDPDAARLMLQEVAMHCSPQQLDDPWLIKGRLCQLVQQRIHVAGPIDIDAQQQHVIALVGPTGVGKTTTLAKLAAGFHFDQGLQVGFITLDTFRLGAIDQLQKYAELLGAPCEVVAAPDQMAAALDRLAHCHLILIDTAGRSPRDAAQLAALNEFLRVAEPTQTHLVLSAASSQAHAEMAIEQFRTLEPTHLLLTKLDESSSLGSWYRLLSSDLWPLSYITTGQNVPEDILAANRRRVASLILGQSSHIGTPRMR